MTPLFFRLLAFLGTRDCKSDDDLYDQFYDQLCQYAEIHHVRWYNDKRILDEEYRMGLNG